MPLFQSVDRGAVFLLGVLSVIAVGALDFATGIELRIYPLYFVPVSFVSWRLGRHAGITFAVLSAVVWRVSNSLEGLERAGTLVAAWNTGAQLVAFLVIAFLMAQLRERLEREQELSRTDPLTGLANGRAFRERATLEVERTRRWRRPLTLACVDLDNFKTLNDTFGHAVGDEVLRTVAVSLRSGIRSTDLAARIGGDEFALLFPETDKVGARVVLESVLGRLHQDMTRAGWPVTASVGSVTTTEATTVESLLRQADRVMYDVKRAGKAAVRAAGTVDANVAS